MARYPKKPADKKGYHWHHIVPQWEGGSDDPSNLVLLSPMEHYETHVERHKKYGHWQDGNAANFILKHMDPETRKSYSGWKQPQEVIDKRLANTDQIARGKAISKAKMGHEVTQETRDKLANNPILKKSKKDDIEANKSRSEAMKAHRLNKLMNERFTTMIGMV